ncbi:MAG TPA: condensation domain-containing protein, partial [Mycobacterium sp.]|nr:condensation domain-containing protein [Mycobacterium sp.]
MGSMGMAADGDRTADLSDPGFADRVQGIADDAAREALLAQALFNFLVRAQALGQQEDLETPAVLESLVAVELNVILDAHLGVELEFAMLRRPVSARDLAIAVATLLTQAPTPAARPVLATDPEGRFEPFGLTDLQQAYLLGRAGFFALGNVPAAFYAEIDVAGVDVPGLEAAWRLLIDRHDMLRTVFTEDGRQRVLAQVPTYRFQRYDLRGLPAEGRAQELSAVRERISSRFRPTDTWPLFEVAVCDLDADNARIHLAIDLLIADGTTLAMMVDEWNKLYQNPKAEIPTAAVSFRDYVRALGEVESSEAFGRAREYWLARMQDLPPAPALPLRVAPESLDVVRFASRDFQLDAQRWTRLRQRSLSNGLTPSMVLCWAYAAVLRVWSGTPSFTLNVTINDRLPVHPDVNRILGEFTSQVLTEVSVDARDTVREQIATLQDRFWTDFEHRTFTAVSVLRELARHSGGTRTTMPYVFDAVLGEHLKEDALPSWFRGVPYVATTAPQVALECQVFELGGGLRVSWAVVEELFPPGLVDSVVRAFGSLLQRLA